jgi:hypothetical protein
MALRRVPVVGMMCWKQGLLLDSENANRAWAKRSIVTEKLSFDDSRPSTWRPPDDDKDAKPQKRSPGPL